MRRTRSPADKPSRSNSAARVLAAGDSSVPSMALITDWRGHRLFGLETPPDYDDLRGLDCLINIAADRLLRTESEHTYALSVWCPRNDMAAGRFDRGLFLRPGRG
jgi:hypothetical protein